MINPFKKNLPSELIVLWETQIKPDLAEQIDILFGGDEGVPEQLTKKQQKEKMLAFLDYAGSRVATLAILDARGKLQDKKAPVEIKRL